MKLLVALAAVFAGLTSAGPHRTPQDKQVSRTCDATAATLQKVVAHAATTQVEVITSHFRVLTPGTLTGKIVFNPSGSSLTLAGDASGSAFNCADGAIGVGVPPGMGRSRVVSTVHEKFTQPGLYTLTLALNGEGRRILARLGARDRAYRKRHPHGHRPPSMAFGAGFRYVPAG